jgi:RHS repeat-associated protein
MVRSALTRAAGWPREGNRLKEVSKTPSTPVLIGEYTYDALNRRVKKVVTNGGLDGTIPNGTTRYLYNSGWQCLEERDGSNNVFKQYVWGRYLRELLQLKTFTTINGNAAGEYYPLCDTLYRTLALTDDTGAIVETYDYDAYGNTLIFTSAGTGANWWADDAVTGPNPTCNNLFTGQYYDPETTLYDFGRRPYAPQFGRFLSRDPLGYVDGMGLFTYVRSAPITLLDTFGLNPNQDSAVDGAEFIRRVRAVHHRLTEKCGVQQSPATVAGALLREFRETDHLYVFSARDNRWIDMRHFFETGRLTSWAPSKSSWVTSVVFGTIVEAFQDLPFIGNSRDTRASAWGVEDWYSNNLGNEFYEEYMSGLSCYERQSNSLASRLERAFIELEVGPASNSRYLSALPRNEAEWQRWKLDQGGLGLVYREGAMVSRRQAARIDNPGLNATAPDTGQHGNFDWQEAEGIHVPDLYEGDLTTPIFGG